MRRLASTLALALMTILAATGDGATAEPEPGGLRVSLDLERHFTTNALTSAFAFPDWYSRLRGTIEDDFRLGETRLKLGAAAELTGHDRLHIEDDRTLAVSLDAERKVGERIELRGSLGLRVASEGDDLAVADTIIGIRTLTQSYQGAVQAGFDLGRGYALLLDAGLSRETPGRTRFEADIIAPERLTPRKDRLEVAARLGRTAGGWTLAAAVNSEFVRAGRQIGAPYRFHLARHIGLVELGWAGEDGAVLSASLGASRIAGLAGALQATRPSYALSVSVPVLGQATLRAGLTAGFDTRNTDDPVASWLERREVEARLTLSERVSLGLGLYSLWREYLTLGGGEMAYGSYAEIGYRFERPITLITRADLSRSHLVGGGEIRKADIFLGLKAQM